MPEYMTSYLILKASFNNVENLFYNSLQANSKTFTSITGAVSTFHTESLVELQKLAELEQTLS